MNPLRETIRFITNEDDSVECLCSRTPLLRIDEWVLAASYTVSIRMRTPDLEDDDNYALTMFEVFGGDKVELTGPCSKRVYHPWRDL